MLRRNVLIFHTGALGDFVLIWPLIVTLSRLYPQSRIFIVTHAGKGQLASSVLGVEWADIEWGWHVLYAGAPLDERAERLLRSAHTVLNFVSVRGDRFATRLAEIAAGAEVITLQPTPRAGFTRQVTAFYLDQLSAYPTIHTALEQMLRGTTQRGLGRAYPRGECIILHPGSGGVDKCWALDKYLALAEQLGAHAPVAALLGEVELERLSDADLQRLERTIPTRRCHTGLELLDALGGAGLYIGNDAGPTHLAGILGIPTLALFGPTDPRLWRPLGPRVRVLHRSPLATLEVDEVKKAALDLRGAVLDGPISE